MLVNNAKYNVRVACFAKRNYAITPLYLCMVVNSTSYNLGVA